jgi:predicted MFS family arabinose efflux permease
LLVGSPYHYSEAIIGLFGLLGAAGALAASFSGRLADRGLERWVTGGSLAVIVASTALLSLGSSRLWALVVGIVLADLGIQAVHIQNQHLIFSIDPSARSRLNTGYMVTYFIGGAIGSAATGLAFSTGGWSAVVILGICFSGAGLLLWAATQLGWVGTARSARSARRRAQGSNAHRPT